jgi:uncharacterized RDD family membrane protein YckC
VLAFFIDWAPIYIAVASVFLVEAIVNGPSCAAGTLAEDSSCSNEPPAFVVILVLTALASTPIYFFWNFCYRQGKTGQSIGKSVLKFKVISEKTWQPIGFWLSFVRQLAHYVDQLICNLGYLWPLWDDKRQTIADKIMSTVCVRTDQPPPPGLQQPLPGQASPDGLR